MSANPYDRRRGPRLQGQAFTGIDLGGPFGHVPAPGTPLTIRDLEAMVYSAMQRGRDAGHERELRAVRDAKREAWAEGHEVGREDGKADLLAEIARQHEERVADVRRKITAMLGALEADPRKVSKSDLAAMLSEAKAVLVRLTVAHHDGFVEPPF